MCDYSLQNVKSRDARVGDRLRVHNFGTGSRGFTEVNSCESGAVAVCVLPGTELAFDAPIHYIGTDVKVHKEAVFRQVHKDQPHMHHDALELPDGELMLLTYLADGQTATVLQLPAKPRTEAELEAQTRVAITA
jgi:hypothetical protein